MNGVLRMASVFRHMIVIWAYSHEYLLDTWKYRGRDQVGGSPPWYSKTAEKRDTVLKAS